MSDHPTPDDHEPDHAESPTAHLLAELQLFGHRPFEGEPDPRPLPEDQLVRAAIADTFEGFAAAMADKRNDQMLDVLPIGVVVFPGTGIQDNLADKARKLGIPLFDFRKGGA